MPASGGLGWWWCLDRAPLGLEGGEQAQAAGELELGAGAVAQDQEQGLRPEAVERQGRAQIVCGVIRLALVGVAVQSPDGGLGALAAAKPPHRHGGALDECCLQRTQRGELAHHRRPQPGQRARILILEHRPARRGEPVLDRVPGTSRPAGLGARALGARAVAPAGLDLALAPLPPGLELGRHLEGQHPGECRGLGRRRAEQAVGIGKDRHDTPPLGGPRAAAG